MLQWHYRNVDMTSSCTLLITLQPIASKRPSVHHISYQFMLKVLIELKIVVKGDFLPRSLFGYFHLLFATIRCIYLAIWMFLVCPHNYNVIIVDQISFSMPILRRCADKVSTAMDCII